MPSGVYDRTNVVPHNKGKTKDNYKPLARVSESLVGKTKFNCKWRKKNGRKISKSLKVTYNTPEGKKKQRVRRRNQIIPVKLTRIELMLAEELKKRGIRFKQNCSVRGICEVDILLRDIKVVIEAFGNYWHANPDSFGPNDKWLGGRKPKSIWRRDLEKQRKLMSKGYRVFIFWEDEILKNPSKCIEKVVEYMLSRKQDIVRSAWKHAELSRNDSTIRLLKRFIKNNKKILKLFLKFKKAESNKKGKKN